LLGDTIANVKGVIFKEIVVYDREKWQKDGEIIMNPNYRKGLRFEHEVRDWLTDRGWVVIRSAGSKTAVDLVGIRNNQTILVQCKYGRKPPPDERMNLSILEKRTGKNIQVLLAYRPKFGRKIDWYTMKDEGNLAQVKI